MQKTAIPKIEVCFSPALYPYFEDKEAIVIVVDILRASTAICAAFMNGANRIIPVATLEEAKAMKDKGYMVAAERDGIVRDFADFGNSPFNFSETQVKGKDIVYSTTNGTQSIQLASSAHMVVVGSYLNFTAIADLILKERRDVLLLCAGWKNKFNLEDTLYAGAIVDYLIANRGYGTVCDSAFASVDLWNLAKSNILEYINKAAQRHRLKKNGLDDVLEYCHTFDLTQIIPVLQGSSLVAL